MQTYAGDAVLPVHAVQPGLGEDDTVIVVSTVEFVQSRVEVTPL